VASAAIVTIGNELVSGDVPNSNGSWLARRLAPLGVAVRLIVAVPDEIDAIADVVRREAPLVDFVLITGGLGGTPDDLTREAIAHAFGVGQEEVAVLADDLRRRFPHDPEYAAAWARLPAGSRPLENPLGGAPGFALGNVYVMPGLPSEMEAMFDAFADKLRGDRPITAWRRAYATRESEIAHLLTGATVRWPKVMIGSYPKHLPSGPQVEIVLKSADPTALAEAVSWLEPQLDAAVAV
jgi:nicotinamide-nucleotide amidase